MEQGLWVLLVTLRYRAPWCRSLKDKRGVQQGALNQLKNKYNVSAVISGPQDAWDLFDITVAALAFSRAQADSMAQNILRTAETCTQAELYAQQIDLL